MKLVYMSLTGQTKKFINKLQFDSLEINMSKTDYKMEEPYVIIVPTYDYQVTCIIDKFIDYGNNVNYLKGVCGSGNKNFNDLFCFTAKNLALKYKVPLIHCFEFNGNANDVEIIKNEVKKIG